MLKYHRASNVDISSAWQFVIYLKRKYVSQREAPVQTPAYDVNISRMNIPD